MFKLIMTFLLMPGFFITHAPEDTIQWNTTRRLIWDDFQGAPDRSCSNAALTSSGIEFKYGFSNETFTYNITCLFDKKKSWGKLKNDYILAHEQAHFDISEIHARKLNRLLKSYRFTTPAAAKKEITAIYTGIMKEQTAMQGLYDEETDHSRDKEKQATWLGKVKRELDRTKEYSTYP